MPWATRPLPVLVLGERFGAFGGLAHVVVTGGSPGSSSPGVCQDRAGWVWVHRPVGAGAAGSSTACICGRRTGSQAVCRYGKDICQTSGSGRKVAHPMKRERGRAVDAKYDVVVVGGGAAGLS